MPSNVLIPYFEPAAAITGHATQPIAGKTCVSYAAGGKGVQPDIATAAAGAVIAGVAAHDMAPGGYVAVLSEGVLPIRCAADVTAGQIVQVVDATENPAIAGQVAPQTAGWGIGRAVTDAAAGTDAPIHLGTQGN